MPFSIDNIFGIHEHALRLREKRTQLLASNMANVDTPSYKARDIDFQAALNRATGGAVSATAMKATQSGHIKDNSFSGAMMDIVKYRIPHQSSLDGNTVESHVEQAAFARHAVEYQATLRFVEGRSQTIQKALKGGE